MPESDFLGLLETHQSIVLALFGYLLQDELVDLRVLTELFDVFLLNTKALSH